MRRRVPSLVSHLVLAGLAVWALYAQWAYRVPGSPALVILPAVCAGLGVLRLLLLIEPLVRQIPPDAPLRRVVDGVERVVTILILGVAAYGYFLFVNARLASPALEARPSEVLAIGGGEPDAGLRTSYGWADLRSWRGSEQAERLLLYPTERRALWGGQRVLLQVHQGFFKVPWVVTVEADEERRLRSILALAPTASKAWKDLVKVYVRRGRYDEALTTAFEYLKLYPNDQDFAVRFAGDLYAASLWPRAVPLLEPFLPRNPSVEVYRMLGFALTRAGRKAAGIVLLKKAIALEPDHWWTYYALAYAHFYDGEFSEAAPWFEKVLDLRPNFPEVEDRLRAIHARAPGRPAR